MFFGKTSISSVTLALLLCLINNGVQATEATKVNADSDSNVKAISQTSQVKTDERNQEYERRKSILNRSNNIFSLLGGEIALRKGEVNMALATYVAMMNRTQDPAVAERAMDMAILLKAYPQAQAIYQKWQEIEPVPSVAQKRMALILALMQGHAKLVNQDLDYVLANVNDVQAKHIFLLLAQSSIQQPRLVGEIGATVHDVAMKYPKMPEAAIADIIFSAQNKKEKDAVAGLKRLSELKADDLSQTELILQLMVQNAPKMLNSFFSKTNSEKLSPLWQEFNIKSLIALDKLDDAKKQLDIALKNHPNTGLLIQAALLSIQLKDTPSIIDHYLNQAYISGTQDERSRVALIGASNSLELKDYAQTRNWINKISSSKYIFDKTILQASLAAEEQKWTSALSSIQQAQRLSSQSGYLFNQSDFYRLYIVILSKSTQPRKAVTELNKLINAVEKQSDKHIELSAMLYLRGVIYADKLHQPKKAIADLRRYLLLNPEK